jgi:hypothetical protein
MREFIDIINLFEVTISKYGPGKKFFISSSEPGKKLADLVQNKGINTTGIIELTGIAKTGEQLTMRDNAPIIQVGPGFEQYEFRTENDEFFYLVGSSSGISKGFVHAKDSVSQLANRGEIAEGLLGAAMFAKFTKRQGNEEIGLVSDSDIWRILESLRQTGKDTLEVTVQDTNSQISDRITFILKLKSAPYKDLMNPLKRAAMSSMVGSAAAYVNTRKAERYSKYFYLNGKADNISIIADGAASETEKKSDVWVAIVDKNGQRRAIRLNTSLKVGGVKQFGQIGGSGTDSLKKLFNHFQIDITPFIKNFEKLSKSNTDAAMDYIYKKMANSLKQRLANDNDQTEYHILNGLAHAITYFATLGDPTVELVDFDDGGFKILNFKNLREKLAGIDFTAEEFGITRPEVRIFNRGQPNNYLIKIRMKIENRSSGLQYVRNIIEKGPLLEKLTQFEYRNFKDLTDIAVPNVVTGKRVNIKPPDANSDTERDKRDSTIRQKR